MNTSIRQYISNLARNNRQNKLMDNKNLYLYGLEVLHRLGIPQRFQVNRISLGNDHWAALLIEISPDYYVHYYPVQDIYILIYENITKSFGSWGDLMEFLDGELAAQSDVGLEVFAVKEGSFVN